MANAISAFFDRLKFGDPIIIVSGLPRSGTSMMMKMLEAGGLAIMTDHERTADVDNPKGYYEFERVKDLDTETDKSWVHDARGKVLKVISHLIRALPGDNRYHVIFMRRDLDEIIASQNKMLVHRGEANPVEDARARDAFLKHIIDTKAFIRSRKHLDLLEVPYRTAIADPREAAVQVNAFLGGRLDEDAMAAVVDPELYRNRAEKLAAPQG